KDTVWPLRIERQTQLLSSRNFLLWNHAEIESCRANTRQWLCRSIPTTPRISLFLKIPIALRDQHWKGILLPWQSPKTLIPPSRNSAIRRILGGIAANLGK